MSGHGHRQIHTYLPPPSCSPQDTHTPNIQIHPSPPRLNTHGQGSWWLIPWTGNGPAVLKHLQQCYPPGFRWCTEPKDVKLGACVCVQWLGYWGKEEGEGCACWENRHEEEGTSTRAGAGVTSTRTIDLHSLLLFLSIIDHSPLRQDGRRRARRRMVRPRSPCCCAYGPSSPRSLCWRPAGPCCSLRPAPASGAADARERKESRKGLATCL